MATPWFVPPGDTDCDGWTDGEESFIGTDSGDACPDDTSDDAWPPDVDNTTTVDVVDTLMFGPVILSNPGDPEYDPRFNLSATAGIDVVDILLLGPVMLESCTNP